MKLVKRKSGWWISSDDNELGPYNTKAEAAEDRRGLERFYEQYIKCPGVEECQCSKRRL